MTSIVLGYSLTWAVRAAVMFVESRVIFNQIWRIVDFRRDIEINRHGVMVAMCPCMLVQLLYERRDRKASVCLVR